MEQTGDTIRLTRRDGRPWEVVDEVPHGAAAEIRFVRLIGAATATAVVAAVVIVATIGIGFLFIGALATVVGGAFALWCEYTPDTDPDPRPRLLVELTTGELLTLAAAVEHAMRSRIEDNEMQIELLRLHNTRLRQRLPDDLDLDLDLELFADEDEATLRVLLERGPQW